MNLFILVNTCDHGSVYKDKHWVEGSAVSKGSASVQLANLGKTKYKNGVQERENLFGPLGCAILYSIGSFCHNRYSFLSMSGFYRVSRFIAALSARIKPREFNIKFETTKSTQIMSHSKLDGHDALPARAPKCEPVPNMEQFTKKKIKIVFDHDRLHFWYINYGENFMFF